MLHDTELLPPCTQSFLRIGTIKMVIIIIKETERGN